MAGCEAPFGRKGLASATKRCYKPESFASKLANDFNVCRASA
jgi:hypothetical protein